MWFFWIAHLDVHDRTCATIFAFHHQNIHLCNFPVKGLERDSTCWWSNCTGSEQRLVQSSATQTANTPWLPLSSFPGAAWEEGGEWIFSVWVAGAPSACSPPPVLDLLCTDETERKLHCSLFLCHLSVCVYMSSCSLFFLNIHSVAVSVYLWCFRGGVRGGTFVLGQWSSYGRQRWLGLGLGMLTGGREGLFELGQQLQQQGEYQAALHCFLSCLLGLTHVQSFTSLPNCLHQVSQMGTGQTQPHTLSLFSTCTIVSPHVHYTHPQNVFYRVFAQLYRHICITSSVEHHISSHTTAKRTHSTLISLTPMSNLTAQSIMCLCVDTRRWLLSRQNWWCTHF